VRGQKVLLDFQLAELYEVEARSLNQAVKRNSERFPEDFMFQLSEKETEQIMRSQIVTTSPGNSSQFVMSSNKHRGLAYRPYAFTGQGVALLSSVLRSPRAVQVNIAIMRTFVQLRQMLASHADLAKKLALLECKYDEQSRVVFDAIRELMEPAVPEALRREIGFHTNLPGRAARPKSPAKAKVSP
jgi:hypothetical protein